MNGAPQYPSFTHEIELPNEFREVQTEGMHATLEKHVNSRNNK